MRPFFWGGGGGVFCPSFHVQVADPSKLLVELPGDFLVWMASPEAAFLKGRSVAANWDVDELKAQTQSIQSGLTMTSGIYGWPYPHSASG